SAHATDTGGRSEPSRGADLGTDQGRALMIKGARFVHTNLIARDWRSLVKFYESVFGCVFVPPERNFSGAMLEAGTGVAGASLSGMHLRLPGHGPEGPTLEIFSYSRVVEAPHPVVNRPGFAHIAFEVASVPEARQAVLAAGGSAVGGTGHA